MIEVTMAIMIGENTAPGYLVSVNATETIPHDASDEAGSWMLIETVLDRIVEDMRAKAKQQCKEYAALIEKNGG